MASSQQKVKNDVVFQGNVMSKTNPKYIDLLDEDKPIAGQQYACMSFVSPEKVLKQKEQFYFQEFVRGWDLKQSLEKFHFFMNFVSHKYGIDFDGISQDLQEFVKEEHESLSKSNIEDDYKTFVEQNEDKLQKKFDEVCDFQTNVRGIKIRGVFPSQKEAELRCKMLREVDPNHDVYVGPVGIWVPFHPEAYRTGRVEYMEETLNKIMNEKKKNEESAKLEFEKRVAESKRKAMEENKANADETGATITQTIDGEGNLVSMKNTSTVEDAILGGAEEEKNFAGDNSEVSIANIRNELFEGDVVMDKNTDHGLSKVMKKD